MVIAAPQRRSYGSLTYEERPGRKGLWKIHAHPSLAQRIKRLLPRVHQERTGTIYLVDTPTIARDLEWIHDRYPVEMNPATHAQLTAHADLYRATEAEVISILNGKRLDTGVRKPAFTPYWEQLESADLALTTGRLLCTDETGLGKTFTALLLLRAADALPALVVTLSHLPPQWVNRELKKFFPELRGHVISSKTVYDPAAVDGFNPDLLAISYNNLAAWSDYLAGAVKTVIFDEIQELRHDGTHKYIAAARIADQSIYRLGLSFTPIFNYGGEAYNIVDVLEKDALGSRDEFTREWGHSLGNGHIKIRDPEAFGDHLRELGLMNGHTREEVGRPLPKPRLVEQPVDADPEVYKNLVGDAVDLARFVLDRANAPTKRWQQAGLLEKRARQATGIAKAPFVATFCSMLLEADTERLILWGWHRQVYDIWGQLLADYHPVMVTGSETTSKKLKNVDQFLDGNSRILIMCLRSGAGLDGLQMGCNTGVWGELDWSPQVPVQCIGRLRRDGITEPPKGFFCVSNFGSDPPMREVLDIKRMQNDGVVHRTRTAFQPAAPTSNHITALATSVLEQAGVKHVA